MIDELLADQQSLTAVERFSRWHDQGHSKERYSHLLPASPPGPGEQYRFEVNLDACTGCKACVSACHSLNGLDDDEAWRDVGLLLGGRRDEGYQQTVTSACHHCADPACANGCPVAAYEKEKDTGVVRHLDDQCIGCQYCVLKCPYDVPKYSARLGIVRKCDMCVGRLRDGEAPACVQACPTSAISIRLVKKEDLVFSTPARMLPGAFDSSYTRPSTRYVSSRAMPRNTLPADARSLRLEHAHWPLIWMLLLTQMSAGMFAVLAVAVMAGGAISTIPVYAATGLLHLGLAVSVLHLGRPMGAWRFFLGLRTSWMSREILAFTLLAGAACMSCAAAWFDRSLPASLGLTAAMGLIAVFTSIMIYVDTHRPFWNLQLTAGKFLGSAGVLGTVAVAVLSHSWEVTVTALLARVVCFAWEQARSRAALGDDECPWQLSARVMKQKLGHIGNAREGFFLASLAAAVGALASSDAACTFWTLLFFLATLAGQVLERYTFFVAAMGPRMTGGYQP